MKALFLVHGSKNIGMGHIMRTLSLASELQSRGIQVSYFSKYEQGLNAIRRHGFRTVKMHASELSSWDFQYGDPDELQSDLSFIKTETGGETQDVIVVDSYNVTDYFFRELKKMTDCLVYIDDLNKFPYPVDLLVNGTIPARKLGYVRVYPEERMLLGTQYNLVRKEFVYSGRQSVKAIAEEILITTGSADPQYMTGKLLEFLQASALFEQLRVHVVIGAGFRQEHIWQLGRINKPNILLYQDVENLSGLMRRCDMAISSGGSTLYELAASGVPTLTFCYAENQKLQTALLEEAGTVKNLGSWQDIEARALLEIFEKLVNNREYRRTMAENARRLVDGLGSQRIVDEIVRLREDKMRMDEKRR